jgi:hypothetical protein
MRNLTELTNAPAKNSYTQGGLVDFAGYKEVCGVIRGLDVALREINDLSRNFMEDEDD